GVQLQQHNRARQQKDRDNCAQRRQRKLVPYAEAVRRRFSIDWDKAEIAEPSFLGTRTLRDVPLSELVPYIDWSPFFMAWELTGKYPHILEDAKVGAQARE